jgi:hypothetical protein
MKIIKLEAENIKGLKAIELSPDGNFIELAGKNGQGKSSALDAVWLALGGGDASKDIETPLRNGEESGRAFIDLGTMTVERKFTSKGTTSLKVTAISDDGLKSVVTSPQGVLDAMRSRFLDPARFASADAKRQRNELLALLDLGIDLDALESERRAIYDERTELGRQGKALGDVPAVDKSLPADEVSASSLLGKIRAAQEVERENADQRLKLEALANEHAGIEMEMAKLQERATGLKANIKAQKAHVDTLKAPADTDALEADLENVEAKNAAIRANNEARTKAKAKAALVKEYEAHTKQIDALDAKKSKAIAGAKLPVEGLGLNEGGLTLNNVPFKDASSGQQLYAALRITAALNPTLRMIQVREGALLDDEHFAIIREFAESEDFQIWFETVGAGHEGAIIIHDGEVQS